MFVNNCWFLRKLIFKLLKCRPINVAFKKHFFCFFFPPALHQVTVEEGKELAREFQCPFFETSAAFRYYIDEVFAALVRQIRQREAEVVRSGERKTRRSRSLWSRLKSPFRKKQHSEHWGGRRDPAVLREERGSYCSGFLACTSTLSRGGSWTLNLASALYDLFWLSTLNRLIRHQPSTCRTHFQPRSLTISATYCYLHVRTIGRLLHNTVFSETY